MNNKDKVIDDHLRCIGCNCIIDLWEFEQNNEFCDECSAEINGGGDKDEGEK